MDDAIFDFLFGSWDKLFRKTPSTLLSLKIEPKHVFQILWTNHLVNFIQIFTINRNL